MHQLRYVFIFQEILEYIYNQHLKQEKVIKGRSEGLCELNDEITWEAKHFLIKQQITVRIAKMNRPFFFEDRMLIGIFKSMHHEHYFENEGKFTLMKDIFSYEVPYSFIGSVFNFLILKKHFTEFLVKRIFNY